MSQAQFASALGVSQGSVSKWEAGKESPRAEVIEKIREISGVKAPEDPPAVEGAEFDTFFEIPLKGKFTDGLSVEKIEGLENYKSLWVYLSPAYKGAELQAWAASGRYNDLPRSFIGIFEMFSSQEIIDARAKSARFNTILTESLLDDGSSRLSLEEINGSNRSGWWLWPRDDVSKNRMLPLRLDDDGTAGAGKVTPIGILVSVLYQYRGTRVVYP